MPTDGACAARISQCGACGANIGAEREHAELDLGTVRSMRSDHAYSGNATYLEAVGLALDSRDGPRPGRVHHRRGRRPVRRRVQGDQGLPRQVRPAPRRRHPDRRDRLHRACRRCRAGRAAAGGGVPVRRLHLLRVRPDHQRAGAAPLANRRPDAGHDARAVRRPAAGRPDAQPERGELLRARARAQDRHAGHPGGRRRLADQLDPGQQPDAVPGEQVPLPAAARPAARCPWSRSRWASRTWSGRAGTSR